ncbi:hypothetical protein M9Y10_025539 [Tritrichomonas musculus]|uniref:Uncharacterized protein n=1 Tax=Tritrichomonas musculus TaxID=1915356 RepID=A0ABR2H8Y4_9EUKA
MRRKKAVQEIWPDDDASPEFIHNEVSHLESFCNFNNHQNNVESNENVRRKKKLKTIELQKFRSTDYVFQSVNNESTLPYNYPPIKHINKQIFQFDERNASVPIARFQQDGVRQTSKKLKRIVEEGFHEENYENFHFTPVRDSVAARSFKCYLKNQGIRSIDLLEEVPFDEYSLNSALDPNSAPITK